MSYLLKEFVDGEWRDRRIAGPELLIGRAPNADLGLDDTTIADQQARIVPEEKNFVVNDLGSTSGTYVNGERIASVFLADGDCITIGPYALFITIAESDAPLEIRIKPLEPGEARDRGATIRTGTDYAGLYTLKRDTKFAGSFSRFLCGTFMIGIASAGLLVFLYPVVLRPGSISQAHTWIGDRCSECHVFPHGPSNKACANCHSGAEHHNHTNLGTEPTCVSCHAEHRGSVRLAMVDNRECVSCHADLKIIDPKTRKTGQHSQFFKDLTDFAGHPQFSIWKVERTADGKPKEHGKDLARIRLPKEVLGRVTLSSVNPVCSNDHKDKPAPDIPEIRDFQGKICLNHNVHLARKIKNGQNKEIQLTCDRCHALDPDGKRMRKITFAEHCADCHQQSDLKIGNKAGIENLAACVVPHGSVEKVLSYLEIALADSQCKPFPNEEPEFRLLVNSPKTGLPPAVKDKIAQVRRDLFGGRGCSKCHQINLTNEAVPLVVGGFIPERWFRQAEFDHKAHRFRDCEYCHVDASKSTQTADVLVPGIETCRSCHRSSPRSGGSREASATTNCASCHTYHQNNNNRRESQKRVTEAEGTP